MRKRLSWTSSILTISQPVVLLLIVQLLSGIVLSPLSFFFPIYLEEQLGYAVVIISASVAIGRLLGMIAAIVGGALSDALGRKWMLVLGLIGFVFGSLLYLVRAPWLVVSLWCISSFGLGLHSLGGQGYLIDVAGSHHLGVASALFHWGYTIGGALSSPGAGLIVDNSGFGAFGLALVAVSLATVLGTMAFLPHLPRGSAASTPSWSRSLLGYREILRHPKIVILGLLRFLPTCYYGMASVLNPLLINRAAGSKTAVAAYATSSLVMATLAQMVAGQAADRWGRRRPTLVTFGVLIFAILGQAAFAAHLWSFYTFGVLGICAAWSLSTLMPCLVSDATTVEERGRVLGTLDLLWNVGMMVGSMIGGALVGIALGLPFFVTGLLNLGAITLAVYFFRLITSQQRSLAYVESSIE
jgi:MFS family permease